VAIARALITAPSLLLADEPTGNLDTESSREIMNMLERLNREGITVILVTHEADIAAYANREILLKDGQVLSDRVTRRAQGTVGV
jgi:putative ABC transport system ATP-binding protein